MEKVAELLHDVEHALQELADSKLQLEALEGMLIGFERLDRQTRKEIADLKESVARETALSSSLRIAIDELEVIGRRLARAWKRMLAINCSEMTDDEKLLDYRVKGLGWYDTDPVHE